MTHIFVKTQSFCVYKEDVPLDESKKFRTVRGYQLVQKNNRNLTTAMEDYLEMIYRYTLEVGLLRTNTLSQLLNVHPSSTTKMVQKLSRFGYVDYEKYGIIILTEKGKNAGEFLYKRHNIIENFLRFIGGGENPLIETELIEHYISPETLSNIELFNGFISENPDIVERFFQFRKMAQTSSNELK